MRLRRLPPLALLGAGTLLAACEPDNSPDVTAPGGYAFDLRTTPATVGLRTALADTVRITSAVINTAVSDTTRNRVAAISGGVPIIRARLQDAADTAVVRFTSANTAWSGAPRAVGPAEVAGVPGLYAFFVTGRAAGTATIILEHTDVNNGNTLADTVRVTTN